MAIKFTGIVDHIGQDYVDLTLNGVKKGTGDYYVTVKMDYFDKKVKKNLCEGLCLKVSLIKRRFYFKLIRKRPLTRWERERAKEFLTFFDKIAKMKQ